MNTDRLDKANILRDDLELIQRWISDLKHINRKEENPYNPNNHKRTALWKKLFSWTKIGVTKNKIEVNPESIKPTYIDVWDIKNEEVSLELGFARARIIDFMIKELEGVEQLTNDKFNNA